MQKAKTRKENETDEKAHLVGGAACGGIGMHGSDRNSGICVIQNCEHDAV